MDECPVCGTFVDCAELETHVNAHFEQEQPPCSAVETVICPLGCGQQIPLAELDAHERTALCLGVPGSRSGVAEDASGRHVGTDDKRPPASPRFAPPSPLPPAAAALNLGLAACPLGCGQMVPLSELDSHELMHEMHRLEQEGGEGRLGGLAAAQAEARRLQEQLDFEALQAKYGFIDKRPGKCYTCGEEGHWSSECPRNPRRGAAADRLAAPPLPIDPLALQQQQRPDTPLPQAADVMQLLASCLSSQSAPHTTAYLCGRVSHYATTSLDRGWGCGWRNVQMMASHLLQRSPSLKAALFGGCGAVPDVPSLQAWCEAAWASGFDVEGAEQLGWKLQGTRKWVGTTEAAALLRFFGVNAKIVEFGTPASSAAAGGRMLTTSDGSTIHADVQCDLCGVCPIVGVRYSSVARDNFDVCGACLGRAEVLQAGPFEELGCGPLGDGSSSGSGSADAVGAAPSGARAGTPALHVAAVGHKEQQQQQQQAGNHGGAAGRATAVAAGGAARRHEALAQYVWRYFSQTEGEDSLTGATSLDTANGQAGRLSAQSPPPPPPPPPLPPQGAYKRLRPSNVVVTSRSPLYFQHEGHSRTIVGIERRRRNSSSAPAGGGGGGPSCSTSEASAWDYSLLVLDPGTPSAAVVSALAGRKQWARLVKRGVYTLRQPKYQLMYVADREPVPEGPQRDALKVVIAQERHP